MITWQIEKRNIQDLRGYDKNPRRFTEKGLKDLKESLKKCGDANIITINADNTVLGGHARLTVMKQLGYKEVDVKVPNRLLNEQEVKEVVIRLNANTAGEWDLDKLQADFELNDLEEWGLDVEFPDLDEQEVKEVDVPEEVETRAKRGDIWQLGNHRLMCGNALIQEDIDKLLNGVHCELTFTDPPYQLDTQGGGILKTANSMKQIKQNGVDTFNPSELILQSETNIYCHNKPLIKKYIELAETNNKPYDLCFYKKLCTVPNYKGHMMTDCEYIAIIGNQDPNKGLEKELYSKCYIGKKDQDNKLSYSKPVELCAKYIKLYAKDKVLDLFGGSGSTLIACEQLNRKCYTMELDPHYCDVIIQRWENLTGKKAVLCEQ